MKRCVAPPLLSLAALLAVAGGDCQDEDARWRAHGTSCRQMQRLCSDTTYGSSVRDAVRAWCPLTCGLCTPEAPTPAAPEKGTVGAVADSSAAAASRANSSATTTAAAYLKRKSTVPSFVTATLPAGGNRSSATTTVPAGGNRSSATTTVPASGNTSSATTTLPDSRNGSSVANTSTGQRTTTTTSKPANESCSANDTEITDGPAVILSVAGTSTAVAGGPIRLVTKRSTTSVAPRAPELHSRTNSSSQAWNLTTGADGAAGKSLQRRANSTAAEAPLESSLTSKKLKQSPAIVSEEEEEERCPEGYERLHGDVYGTDQFTGTHHSYAASLADCASRCSSTPGCGSFEYNRQRRQCFRNSQTRPTHMKHRPAVVFCRRAPCPSFQTEAACIGPSVAAGRHSKDVAMPPGSYCIWSGGACQAPVACTGEDCFLPDGGLPRMELPSWQTLWISRMGLEATMLPAKA